MLSGSTSEKAVRRMLMKSTPGLSLSLSLSHTHTHTHIKHTHTYTHTRTQTRKFANPKAKDKALHSELLAELSGRFSGRNEYFQISEVRIVRHFFEVFGKFGISKFPKLPNFFRNFRTFFRTFYQTFLNFLTEKQGFLP